MTEQTAALVTYRLERAREAIAEAKILLEQGHTNTFVNRFYYACFYAVSALLLNDGLSSSKHSGVRALFHKHCIKTGSIAPELGHTYDNLFDNRQKGDYADLYRFPSNEVAGWYDETCKFVEAIESVVKLSA
jgi:uncharacterized protein (UPF0332 family)